MDAYKATKNAAEAAIKAQGSQAAVARALGVSDATVSYWKHGEQIASLENYLALLDLGEHAPARKGAARILGSVLAVLIAASGLTLTSKNADAAYKANPLISKGKQTDRLYIVRRLRAIALSAAAYICHRARLLSFGHVLPTSATKDHGCFA